MILDLMLCLHLNWSCMLMKFIPTSYRLVCWENGETKPSTIRFLTEKELTIMLTDFMQDKEIQCIGVHDTKGRPTASKEDCEEKYLDKFLHKAKVCEKVNLTPKEKDYCYTKIQKAYRKKVEECKADKKQKWKI